MSVNIAREAVLVRRTVTATAARATRQGEITDAVFGASNEATRAIQEVSASAELISSSTDANLGAARHSLDEMHEIVRGASGERQAVAVQRHGRATGQAIRQHPPDRRTIRISPTRPTSWPSEMRPSRRPGPARWGASPVVADEVRKLAERVNVATQEITGQHWGMIALVQDTQHENEAINADIRQTRQVVEQSSGEFSRMVSDFERTGDQLTQIAAAMEETHRHQRPGPRRRRPGPWPVHRSFGQHAGHRAIDNQAQRRHGKRAGTGFRFKIGAASSTPMWTRRASSCTRSKPSWRNWNLGGHVWDQNYRPVAGTNPQKYDVSYGKDCERDLQPSARPPGGAQRRRLCGVRRHQGLRRHPQPEVFQTLTGNYDVDLAGNRTRCIFEDPTGQRAAKNQLPLLLQTYARDTGEILSEINLPIKVNGRHWGGLRVGCESTVLLEG